VHPVFGPWIGLRAAAVLDVDAPAGAPPLAPLPCRDCAHACEPAFARALGAGDAWRAWLAVRDACPVGRTHRYGEAQLRYHCTKDRTVLAAAAGD
jgi:methylmalonic aciduria homocystinuria type C protein